MRLNLSQGDCADAFVDHDGPQGLAVYLSGVVIHFDDERDALRIARQIVDRLEHEAPRRPEPLRRAGR